MAVVPIWKETSTTSRPTCQNLPTAAGLLQVEWQLNELQQRCHTLERQCAHAQAAASRSGRLPKHRVTVWLQKSRGICCWKGSCLRIPTHHHAFSTPLQGRIQYIFWNFSRHCKDIVRESKKSSQTDSLKNHSLFWRLQKWESLKRRSRNSWNSGWTTSLVAWWLGGETSNIFYGIFTYRNLGARCTQFFDGRMYFQRVGGSTTS